jgi:hypothetical protein
MSSRYSLYKIGDANAIPFSACDYSRFKYGDSFIAKRFGVMLATSFLADYPEIAHAPAINLFSSPYQFIPTATYPLAISFLDQLNFYRLKFGLSAAKFSRVFRHTTYTQDYGQMSAAMRRQLIGADLFDFEGVRTSDEFLLLIDDILITGSHEYVVGKALQQAGYTNPHMYLYFAELVNGAIDPSIENQLNYAAVHSYTDFKAILVSPAFQFNTRNVKYMLGLPLSAFRELCDALTENKLQQMAALAIGNDYHLKPELRENLLYIIPK